MLIGNYSVLRKSPGRSLGGSGVSVEVAVRSNWGQSGSLRAVAERDRETTAIKLWGAPTGQYRGWLLPIQSGDIASINEAVVTVAGSGLLVGGITTTGTATITFTVPDAAGELIASGSGSASFTFTPSGLLTASIGGTGSASFTFEATGEIGALASVIGSASFSFTTTLEAYAIGIMSGSTVDNTTLTAASITDAVWNATAAIYDTAGTMGEKVNDAGSASNPWTEVIESGLTAAEILRLIAAAVQGSATGLEDGSPVFKSIDGMTDRITATYVSGTRTVTARDAT